MIVADQCEQFAITIEAELTKHFLIGDRAIRIELIHHELDETQIRSHSPDACHRLKFDTPSRR